MEEPLSETASIEQSASKSRLENQPNELLAQVKERIEAQARERANVSAGKGKTG